MSTAGPTSAPITNDNSYSGYNGQPSPAQATAGDMATPLSGTLTFNQIEAIWIANGGSVQWAPTMAAIALAESGGRTTALNNNPSTGDYSVGLWQINYFQGLLGPRTAEYGSPAALQGNANLQAQAAIKLLGNNGAGISNWKGDPIGNYVQSGQPLSLANAVSLLNQKGIGTNTAKAGATLGAPDAGGANTDITKNLDATDPTGVAGKVVAAATAVPDFLGMIVSGFGIGWKGVLSMAMGAALILIGLLFIFHKQVPKIATAAMAAAA